MALVLADRVQETCSSPGTGTATLLGAVTGFQTFLAAIGNGNTCYYTIADQSGGNWEVGIGTVGAGTLARTTVLSSSNGGSATNFSTGTQNVFVTYPSEIAAWSSNNPGSSGQVLTSNGTGVAPSWQSAGGGFEVGETIIANSAPTTGTWLQTGKYYSKATYPALAAKLGNISDLGFVDAGTAYQPPVAFYQNTTTSNYITATNGTVTVVVGQGGKIQKTLNTSGTAWSPAYTGATSDFQTVSYLNGYFIAGTTLAVYISTDGSNWTKKTSGLLYNSSIAYGASTYVSVGLTGVYYSTDLTTWTAGTGMSSVTRVVYGNGTFVAVTQGTGIFTSAAGATWTQVSSASAAFTDVIYANSLFVAVGSSGAVYTSPDGTTWTSRSAGSTGFNNVAYLNGLFIAVGAGVIYTSPDGTTWTSRTTNVTCNLFLPVWNGTNYMVPGAPGGLYLTSPDGITWTAVADPALTYFISSTVINGKTILLGGNSSYGGASVVVAGGTRQEVLKAGVWNYQATNAGIQNYKNIAYNGSNQYVMVGGQGGSWGAVLYSGDGNTWSAATTTTTGFFGSVPYAVSYLNGNYLAGGASGNIVTSSNGSSWTVNTSGRTTNNYAFAYGASTYVVVGAYGTAAISYSTNLSTWAAGTGGPTVDLYDVIFANSKFVAVGVNGNISYSTTGTSWTTATAGTTTFNRVIFANSLFVAVGNSGVIYTSPDGVTWTAATSSVTANLFDVVWNGSVFVAVGATGKITTSATGTGTWTNVSPGDTSQTLYSIAWSGTKFIINAGPSVWSSTSSTGAAGTWTRVSTAVVQGNTNFATYYLGGKFISSGTGFTQTSTDGFTWTASTNVQYVPTTCYRTYKLNNVFFLCTDKGLFSSTDGMSWSVATRLVGPNQMKSVAYGGGKWVFQTYGFSGMSDVYYASTDGVTFTKSADMLTSLVSNYASGNMAIDLVYANGYFLQARTSTADLSNVTLFRSSTSTTWTSVSGFTSVTIGSLAADGTTAALTTASGLQTSIDGGATWVAGLASPTSVYCWGGLWLVNLSSSTFAISKDLSTYTGATVGTTNVYGFYDGSYIYSTPTNTANAVFMLKAESAGYYSSQIAYPFPSKIPSIALGSPNFQWIVVNGTTALAPMTSGIPGTLGAIPLYTYNTSTTFWVPPLTTGGQASYIYAGA